MGLDIYFYQKRKHISESEQKTIDGLNEEYNNLGDEVDQIYENKKESDLTEEEKNRVDNIWDRRDKISKEVCSITGREEVAYFRKVNFLMSFFGYDDNCADLIIDKEQVEELVDKCYEILETVKNGDDNDFDKELAEELLPTEDGFFFGSTDYDDYYIYDVRLAHDTFSKLLADLDFDEYDLIMNCWW